MYRFDSEENSKKTEAWVKVWSDAAMRRFKDKFTVYIFQSTEASKHRGQLLLVKFKVIAKILQSAPSTICCLASLKIRPSPFNIQWFEVLCIVYS
jgi:hypothetical protein